MDAHSTAAEPIQHLHNFATKLGLHAKQLGTTGLAASDAIVVFAGSYKLYISRPLGLNRPDDLKIMRQDGYGRSKQITAQKALRLMGKETKRVAKR